MKSYFAGTVEAALRSAQQELGPEAMLVDSRRTGPDTRHLGEYEVVCAVLPATGDAEPSIAAVKALPELIHQYRAPSLDKLSQEVSEMKGFMQKIAATIARSSAGLANLRSSPELATAFGALTAAEVDSTLAHDVVVGISENATESSDIDVLLTAAIEKLLKVDPNLGRTGARQKIVALVGPPGCGKTTSLVKLAAQYGIAMRRPTQILTVDTQRVAAAEQLRSYATILGVGFQVLETTAALAQALEEHRSKDLILIDTPGFTKNDIQDGTEIAQFLSTHPGIDTHLVLPISLKAPDLWRIYEQYKIFKPGKVAFTRLDETESFGSILNIVVSTGQAVSFLSSGQQIPEDLKMARKETLARLILQKQYAEQSLKTAFAAA